MKTDLRPEPASDVPLGARILGGVGRTLITAGVVVLLFVTFQLWGTNVQEARAQDGLRDEFDDRLAAAGSLLDDGAPPVVIDAGSTGDPEGDALPAPTTTIDPATDPEILSLFFPEDGDAVARIEIPSIGVDKIVVNGVQVADLRKGPGYYDRTAPVGTSGNTAIAGHRTTYGAPFNRIDELMPGDEIVVTGALGRFTYRVLPPEDAYPEQLHTVDDVGAGHVIVRPGDTWVLGDFRDNRVTLTACHPKLSSRQRIIVAAELVEEPVVAPTFDPEVVAAALGEDVALTLPSEDVDADGVPATTDLEAVSLDEGLDGERDAIPGAVAWMLAATALWVLAGIAGRRLTEGRPGRVLVRVGALVPVGVCLWFSFEMIDRALPAG